MSDPDRIPDLHDIDVTSLSWDTPEVSAESIDLLYQSVREKAHSGLEWYWAKSRGRKRWAQILRGLAVMFAMLGLMVPAAALVWPGQIPSELGYLMFVLVGGCLLANSVIGISSGWIRYVVSATAIQRSLDEFQLDWAMAMAPIDSAPRDNEDIAQLINKLRRFVSRVNEIVEQETQSWGDEFQNDLARLERTASARP